MTSLTTHRPSPILPASPDKDTRSRLLRFSGWLAGTRTAWYQPDLVAYRDDLAADGLQPASVQAHLSTVRNRYRELVRDRDLFWQIAPEASGLERKAWVDETIQRIENAIHPDAAPIKLVDKRDRPDAETVRLTPAQVDALLSGPDITTPAGVRDRAVLALFLATGIREAELAAVEVAHLYQRYNGHPALLVPLGKGAVQRMVVYGAMEYRLADVERWLRYATIENGPVFRGFYPGYKRVRENSLTTRTVQNIVKSYPVYEDGEPLHITPHTLRRTYARACKRAGMTVEGIARNMGHASTRTTWRYIGDPDVEERVPPELYDLYE